MQEKHICHDCGRELKSGEEFISYEGVSAIKCSECFAKDSVLKNFQVCDVYSRVVGFHTPVRRWNDAKSEEWKDRKTYRVNGIFQSCCEVA